MNALDRLDPVDRALIRLSVVRDMDDAEIARRAGIDVGDVRRRRDAALRLLAAELEPGEAGPGAPVATPSSARSGDPWAAPERRHRRVAGVAWAVAAAIVIAAIVVVAVTLGSRGGSARPAAGRPGASTAASGVRPPARSRPAALVRLPEAPRSARATATTIARGASVRLRLTVHGLPRPHGHYEVWLYDSVLDAVPVARFDAGRAIVNVTLPRARLAPHRALDVSYEPPDGNPNHSGQSLLRVPVAALLRAR